ncbi:MAG TPA: BF3164 family lipoprotein [Longimicrobium sp.]|nr:BF3164 family lipoprotein [Longimicrobium sp.]
MRGEVLFEGEALGRPQSIGVLDDWLLVSDVPRPHALHVIRRADGRYLKSWGREGGGPGEFRTLWSIQPAGRGGAWLYDPGQSRLTLLDVPALLAGAGDPVRRSVNLRAELMPMTALWASDTLLVSSGLFERGRLALFDGAGRLKHTAGPLPPAREGVPAAVAQHAYSGTLALHPSRLLVAIGTRHADRVEIYDADGRQVHVGRGPRGFEPVYEVQVRGGAPAMASGGDMRFGYVDLAAAGEHLYALYSGRSRDERPGQAHYGGEVHVFDWSGRLRRILPLDHLALALAVSPDERDLYTVRHNPAPAVMRQALPHE